MKKNGKGYCKTKRINKKKVAVAVVLPIVVLITAAALFLLPEEGKNILEGIGRISTAKLENNNTVYSYYDENGKALLTPYTDHLLGSGMMAEVIVPYGECTSAKEESNKSNPLCSPLVRGTVDRVVSVVGAADEPVYCLESGVKVNDEYLKITENGFLLPDNTLTVSSCGSMANGVQFKLNTLWAVPVQITAEPQEYFTGYLQRIYNVSQFTAEYIDIRFARTTEFSGELDFSGSDIVRTYEWHLTSEGGVLRLYLKKTGKFYGYSYSLDKNGRFVFTIKRNITADTTPVVMLDPGHGGTDPGAESLGTAYESTLTLDIAEKTAQILADQGVKVYMTRRDERDVSLDERIAMTRKYAPSLFVAVHCDSSETEELYGTHSFYYKSYSAPLAQSINKHMASVYKTLYASDAEKAEGCDRGIKFYPFAVTRVEECPSVLVECGYLSNPEDCNFLLSEQGRAEVAMAIVLGVLEQLNVEYISPDTLQN